jgi:tetratricopeptide (TPR) repeat protein
MNDLVDANDKSAKAHLLRAKYRRQYGVGDASEDVRAAAKLAPDDADVYLTAATIALGQQHIDEARETLRRGYEHLPNESQLHLAAAQLELQYGMIDAAVARLEAGLEKLPRQRDLLWEKALVLTLADRKAEAENAIQQLQKDNFPKPFLDCLGARWEMREEKWPSAIAKLHVAYADLTGQSNQPRKEQKEQAATLSLQAGLWLGECFERIGDFERAYDAYSRVAARDDRQIAARQGMAATRAAQGRFDEAIDQYQQLLRLIDHSSQRSRLGEARAAAIIDLARLQLLRARQTKVSEPNWAVVDEALKKAEEKAEDLPSPPPSVAKLRADFWAAQKDYANARKALTKNYNDPKTRPAEIWAAMATLEDVIAASEGQQGKPDAALTILDDAQRHSGDSVELRLARARHALARGPDAARTALPPLAEGIDQFSGADQRRLVYGLGPAFRQAGLTEEAARLWRRLADAQTTDLRSRIELFDLAAAAGDNSTADQWRDEIRKLEGEDGVTWRFAQASVLVGRAARGEKEDLQKLPEARRLLNEINLRRPNWSQAALCEARLCDLEKAPDVALQLYLKAIKLGAWDPTAVGRAVVLLHQRHRYKDANALVGQLPKDFLFPQGAEVIAADTALRGPDKAHALALAERAVSADSKDYHDQLWLGCMYCMGGKEDKAVAAIRRARDLAPDAPETWLTLVEFLVRADRKKDAEAEVEAARKRLTAPEAAAALAQCHEMVGQTDRARELYQVALRLPEDDAAVLRPAAEFFLRTSGNTPQAREVLERLSRIRPAPTARGASDRSSARWARRWLALFTAAGNPANVQEALKWLGDHQGPAPAGDDEDAILDQRTRAQLLVLQGTGTARQQAIVILDDLIQRNRVTPEDYLLAGQLHEKFDNWPRAQQCYLALVKQERVGPTTLAAAARFLLRHKEIDTAARALQIEAAAQALGTLEKEAPQAVVIKEIRARVLYAQDKKDAAIALVKEIAQTDGADVPAAAAQLEEFGDFAGAEELYRGHADKTRKPQDVLASARFLIRRQRVGDALELCDRSWETCPPVEVAQTCLLALSKTKPSPDQLARIAARLEAAIAQAPDQINLVAALAAVRNYQNRFDEAADLYGRVLEKDPRNVTALNNLAWLLALREGQGKKALEFADRAIQAAGPIPDLRDTRAVAHLALGQSDAAISELTEAVAESATEVIWFHLARAYELAGRHREAERAWAAAKAKGLNVERLHPLEQDAYRRLVQTMPN